MNEELKIKIIKWSKDRGIIPNASPLVQFAKLMSEFSEIFEALRLLNKEKLIDAIGDVQVVLINLSELLKLEDNSLEINFNYSKEFNSINEVAEYICNIGDKIIKHDYKSAVDLIEKSYECLTGYSRFEHIDPNYALECAYNEIKDRKGFLTPEGNFIKDSDPMYQEIIKKYKK